MVLCGQLTLPRLTQADAARSSDEGRAFVLAQMHLISRKVHEFAGFSANLLHKIQGNRHLRTKKKTKWGDSARASPLLPQQKWC